MNTHNSISLRYSLDGPILHSSSTTNFMTSRILRTKKNLHDKSSVFHIRLLDVKLPEGIPKKIETCRNITWVSGSVHLLVLCIS